MPEFLALACELEKAGIEYKKNEGLAAHTSFKIGGNAELFIIPKTEEQLIMSITFSKKHAVKYFLLGNGTNVLFTDKGFYGAVIHIGSTLSEITTQGETVTAQAGASLADVCLAARDAGLTGLEFAYGIPGCVGGAVFMNAGAYDGEIKDIVSEIKFIDENGIAAVMQNADARFGYRSSAFQEQGYCILRAVFKLKHGKKEEIHAKMQDLAKRRAEKQPLEMPSAGSAFKRPEGAFAGALIDKCGLRGKRVGGAGISEKHCGFIVNNGNATSEDVLKLADEVCRTVYEQTGYNLEKEIRVID